MTELSQVSYDPIAQKWLVGELEFDSYNAAWDCLHPVK